MSNYTVQSYLTKAGLSSAFDPNDPLTDTYANLVALYHDPAKNGQVSMFIESCLRARRIIYWKNTPGDCGTQTQVNIGTTNKIVGTIQSLSAKDPEPISHAILSVAGFITGIFGAHHAAAVQKEQTTLCEVALYFNTYCQQVIQQGTTGNDAKKIFTQVRDNAKSAVAAIEKPCNAGCFVHHTLDALTDLFIKLYGVESVAAQLNPKNPSAVGLKPGTLGIGEIALAGGAGFAAHLAGVF